MLGVEKRMDLDSSFTIEIMSSSSSSLETDEESLDETETDYTDDSGESRIGNHLRVEFSIHARISPVSK